MKVNRFGSAMLGMLAMLHLGAAAGEEHLIKAAGVKFDPQITCAQPGDTVT